MGALNGDPQDVAHLGEYCREIEAYLCAKNQGHLIRIAGPSFTRVCGWAAHGIPVKVVFRGVDRYVERYHARGPKRRPVLIDFCEADVLDVFDEWRRAVGVATWTAAEVGEGEAPAGRSPSLPLHLDRAIARLTALRAGGRVPAELDRELEHAARELDLLRASAKGLRGDARTAALSRLDQIDQDLLTAVRGSLPAEELEALRLEAAEELRPFQARMPEAAYQAAVRAAADRLLRERRGLPRIGY